MYLTQLKLPKTASNAAVISRFLENKYKEHIHLWSMMGVSPEASREFIFRSDMTEDGLRVLVLSPNPLQNVAPEWILQAKAFAPSFEAGQLLQFKVRITPVIDIVQKGARSKRTNLVSHLYLKHEKKIPVSQIIQEAASQWLGGRAANSGFTLLDCVASNYQKFTITEKAHPFEVQSLDIEGVIEVTQPELLIERLISGFGKSKYLGFGLMLVRPV